MRVRVRVLDLDGSVAAQTGLIERHRPPVLRLRTWGPSVRLACAFGRFRRFERAVADLAGSAVDCEPVLTFYGSGDFHHVSLALTRRQAAPFNLLVIDNHPDWMRGVPFLHCGTWLYHAARLPGVGAVFHVGGDVDFDNAYRWLAPWPLLRAGKVRVVSAVRRYRRGGWCRVAHDVVRPEGAGPVTAERAEALVAPWRAELARRPLYVSLDKDVVGAGEAPVNWDSGRLTLDEVGLLLQACLRAAGGRLAGMDVGGDWSPVRVRGPLRRALHVTEHPPLRIDPAEATRRNEAVNLAVAAWVAGRQAGRAAG